MMKQEANPVKDLLFEYIGGSRTIPPLVSEKRFDRVIDEIIDNCYEKAISMGEEGEVVGILATGILHYLLTNALIPSQRKTEFHGTELDIVIPDVRTLESDQERALLICIPGSSDVNVIREKITRLESVQTVKENIWLVLSRDVPTGKRSFVLSRKDGTFSGIIFEIAKFSNAGGANKFKIMRI